MRELADQARIREFMRRLGEAARREARIYITGGGTAVLLGWRPSTVDLDIKIVPDSDEILRAIPALKEALQINVELASPDQFIPPVPGWEDRSRFEAGTGRVQWYHYDPYSQALSKIERDHPRDRQDVRAMLDRGLIEPARLRESFERIKADLYRYPAIDPKTFEERLERTLIGGEPADPMR